MHHVLCKIADMLTNLVNRHLYKTKKLRNKQWWKPVIVAGNAKFHIHGPDPGRGRGPSPPQPQWDWSSDLRPVRAASNGIPRF